MYSLKNVKNTHGGVILKLLKSATLLKLFFIEGCFSRFLKKSGIFLIFVYLVKLLSNHEANLTKATINLKNISNFEGCGLTLVAYKKM